MFDEFDDMVTDLYDHEFTRYFTPEDAEEFFSDPANDPMEH